MSVVRLRWPGPATLRNAAIVIAAYLLTSWAGAVAAHEHAASPWWLPSAVGFLALLLGGARWLPVVALAEYVNALLFFHISPWLGLVNAVVFKATYLPPALLLRRRFGSRPNVRNVRQLTWLLVLGAGLGGVTSAVVGEAWSLVEHTTTLASVPTDTLLWWAGDAVGIACLVPAVLDLLVEDDRWLDRVAGKPEAVLQIASVLAVPLLVVSIGGLQGALVYLCAIPLLWTALRPGFVAGASGALLVDIAATIAATRGGDSLVEVAELQMLVVTLSVTASYVAAASHEKRAVLAEFDRRLTARTAELAAVNEQLTHQAFHDPLTALANRALFLDRVEHAVALHARDLRPLAVLYVDLDDFKRVNDIAGHAAGDELLVRFAERLRGVLRPADTVARLGGDEFAILLESAAEGDAEQVADRIVEASRQPFRIGGTSRRTAASVGLVRLDADCGATTAARLLERADVAMYAAKRAGKGVVRAYKPGLEGRFDRDVSLRLALLGALEAGDVEAWYQPIVDIATGRMVGCEALARWELSGVAVDPSVFVPVADRAGLLGRLSRAVLEQAIADVARLRMSLHLPRLYVSVNLAPEQLIDPTFPDLVGRLLAERGLGGDALVVEVTEHELIADLRTARANTERLVAEGVRVALDDFGAGYAGLGYLRRLPITIVKIDRTYVTGVSGDTRRAQFLRAFTEMARELELTVVAEGVESADQLGDVAELGVPLVQGFWTGRPARPENLLIPQARIQVVARSADRVG